MMLGSEIVITFLGTGSAIPPLGRYHTSLAMEHPHGTIIFDCGEGAQYSFREYKISSRKEFIIAISHLHADHLLGVPGLISSFQLLGRNDKITILGPKGLNRILNMMFAATFVRPDFELDIIELNPNDTFIGRNYRIIAKKAIHEGRALSYIWIENSRPGKVDTNKLKELGIPKGPLIGELQRGKNIEINGKVITSDMVLGKSRRGRVIVYTGDTSPNPTLMNELPDIVDLLVHEGTYPSDMNEEAEERGHSTWQQAAELASTTGTKMLILTHLSPRFTKEVSTKEEKLVKEIFPDTIIAYNGLRYVISLIK